ncbi:MAG: hypothetical protein IJJ23_04520 [Clostridia bacterium]|nr:hypothetical protein [Clostridia bacterium]
MKKKLSISLIAAALAALLLIGAALAVSQTGLLASWLGVYNAKTGEIDPDGSLAGAIQYLDRSVEGSALRCVVTEALYDPDGGTYSLAWRYEPLFEGDTLYVVCSSPTFGGEFTDTIMGMNDCECLLTGPVGCSTFGHLPENGGTLAAMTFSVYRVKGEIEHKNVDDFAKPGMTDEEINMAFETWFRSIVAEGRLNMEGDGVLTPIWWDKEAGGSFEETLVRAGLLERVEELALEVDIGAMSLPVEKVMAGPAEFTFENGDSIRVNSLSVTPMIAKIEAEYITSQPQRFDDAEHGLCIFVRSPHETQSYGCNTAFDEPVQEEDGRLHAICHIQASPMRDTPDALELKIVRYEGGEQELIGTAVIELADKED